MRRPGPTSSRCVRLLIADDYPFFRRGLRVFLEDQPGLLVAGEAGTVPELLKLCQELRPDVVLLDLHLAGADGVSLIDALRERWPKTRHIVFVTPDDEKTLADCIENGVGGCVMKNADPPLILSAIRAVSAGEHWLQRELTGTVFEQLRHSRQAGRERAEDTLTDRETDVLKLLAQGLRNSQIAEHLYISERTVKVHIANIFAKLQLHDRVHAARYAIRTGLVQP